MTRFVLTGLAGLLCFCAAASVSIGASNRSTVVEQHVLLSGPPVWETAPLLALVADQPLKDKGIVFTFQAWKSPAELRQLLMGDKPVLAVAPSLMAAVLHARDIPFALVAGEITDGSVKLIGKGAPLERLSDLQGTTLALPFKGNFPDLLLKRLDSGDTPSFRPLYTGNYMASMQMLIAGKAGAALLVEPLATMVTGKAPDLHVIADTCVLWKAETGLSHCPVAGALLANPVLAADKTQFHLVRDAHRQAFEALAVSKTRPAELLSGQFAELPRAAAVEGFVEIRPRLLPMPGNRSALEGFLKAIASVSPEAVGGVMPDADFYGNPAE